MGTEDKVILELLKTSAWLTSNNPILLLGQQAFESDTGRSKIGDAVTAWTSLVYRDSPPIGAQYIQYAVSDSNDVAVSLPVAEAPTALFGGTWEKLWEIESVFFRTEGSLANTGRAGGLQEDQFQGHEHSTGYQDGNNTQAGSDNRTNGVSPGTDTEDIVTDGVNGTPRSGAYTHPKNRLMRIWRRTA